MLYPDAVEEGGTSWLLIALVRQIAPSTPRPCSGTHRSRANRSRAGCPASPPPFMPYPNNGRVYQDWRFSPKTSHRAT